MPSKFKRGLTIVITFPDNRNLDNTMSNTVPSHGAKNLITSVPFGNNVATNSVDTEILDQCRGRAKPEKKRGLEFSANGTGLIDEVKAMTKLVQLGYESLLDLAMDSPRENAPTVITHMRKLINAQNAYVNYINQNGYCKAPILRVKKELDCKFTEFIDMALNSSATQLELETAIIRLCDLGKQYAHKTKFTVMNIPVDCLDS
jgi:hypothetical protein